MAGSKPGNERTAFLETKDLINYQIYFPSEDLIFSITRSDGCHVCTVLQAHQWSASCLACHASPTLVNLSRWLDASAGESRDLTQAFKLARAEAREKVDAMIVQLLAAAPTVPFSSCALHAHWHMWSSADSTPAAYAQDRNAVHIRGQEASVHWVTSLSSPAVRVVWVCSLLSTVQLCGLTCSMIRTHVHVCSWLTD